MTAAPEEPGSESSEPTGPQVVRGSGDAAVAAAAERSAFTAGLNIADVPALPTTADTANLRLGAHLSDSNLIILPLVGVWRGEGEFVAPGSDVAVRFGQQVTISHDGRGFLRHESVMWLLDDAKTPASRELGWWRPQPDGEIELLIAHSEGVVEVFYGRATSLTSWNLSTDAVVRTTTAPSVTGATRLYGVVDGKLAYVEERATVEHALHPHTSALLERVAG
ncbi:FABP family protein [Nakamurella silvestris]|nr:FABP family protein [Nakamurella silvestris]